jgi:Fe/S biogenesis protein NfuA
MSDNIPKITLTDGGQDYLSDLLSKQDDTVIGIRMFVNNPGTPRAETCIAYCREKDVKDNDVIIDYEKFKVWYEGRSVPFLEDAIVDFNKDRMGGQLTIRAPNSKMPRVGADSPIEDRINYILYNEVNPNLASHGGEVSLVEIAEEEQGKIAVLKFGGGCQGCSAVDVTLKQGVEKSLLDQVPELFAVRDMTDHTDKSQAYIK